MGGNQPVHYGFPQPERDAADRAGVDHSRETCDVDKQMVVAIQSTSRSNEENDGFVAAAFNASAGLIYRSAFTQTWNASYEMRSFTSASPFPRKKDEQKENSFNQSLPTTVTVLGSYR
ncbi:hypothetical protein RRG08_041268 [Elysia crispata]|uniref:Uncharacterized protein n=1 Tax=Elysia crispata TaxID=231223 RepID=A0AAE1DCF5_9GAST|nr:hypothetical protein RRG08_041268 [Elysia crispata]